MNRSLFLHVVERLEGLVGRLPATIQKPILSELSPLKELFLKQRSPRFLFSGSANTPLVDIMTAIFPEFKPANPNAAAPNDRWRSYTREDRGTISVLDGRAAGALELISKEVDAAPADIIFFLDDENRKKMRKEPVENLLASIQANQQSGARAGVIGIVYGPVEGASRNDENQELADRGSRLAAALEAKLKSGTPLLRIVAVGEDGQSELPAGVISAIARHVPNDARIETARAFGDRQTQSEIGQALVKSTTAICTAIGAQPIPLADLPILTTLQLVMVSGIMYISGRERSLRAATEFLGALGANVGAGMLLREGARALLKLIPGWGNVVCGMVAGAGTYAIGRAAIAYFLEGVSLKDARRTYLANRRSERRLPLKSPPSENRLSLPAPKRSKRLRLRR